MTNIHPIFGVRREQPLYSRVPAGEFDLWHVPTEEAIRWAISVVDGAKDTVRLLQDLLRVDTGFRSGIPLRTIFVGICLLNPMHENLTLENVHRVLRQLPAPYRSALSIEVRGHEVTYRQIHQQMSRLVDIIRTRSLELHRDPADTYSWVMNRFIESGVRELSLGSSFAIDTTDVETPARTVVDDSFPEGDGRRFSSKDPEAKAVHIPARNGNKSSTGTGFELTTCVQVEEIGGSELPGVMVAARLGIPNTERDSGCLWAADDLAARGVEVRHLVFDKAYSGLGSRMLDPLSERGIEVTFDLKAQQRAPRPDWKGAKWVDGDLACPAIWPLLVNLPAFVPAMPDDEAQHLARRYDAREPFMFGLRQKASDPGDGDRMECPARRGTCRCPLVGRSMRKDPGAYPTVVPPEDHAARPCCAQRTITLPRIASRRAEGTKVTPGQPRQKYRYGSSMWLASWRRRVKVESGYSALKIHSGALRRGIWRTTGRAMPSFYIAFMVAWANSCIVRAYDYRWGISDECEAA